MKSAIKYHSNCFDEGLSLETLGLETLYSGKFTSSTQAIKPNCLATFPTDAALQFR